MVPEGKDVGKAVQLRPFQREILVKIYDNPYRTRRAIISFGRKNAKTTLAAFLLLLHLAGPESVPNSQLNSAAQSRDQAGLTFDLAAKCVRLSRTLSQAIVIRDTAKQLLCPERGTKYKALSAEVSTSFGLGPVFIIHDELGQVRGPRSELYEALETATAANEEPLSIIISTQAPTDADLLSVLIDDADTGEDPHTVLVLYTAPVDMDPFSEEAIKAANPAFGDFQNAVEVLAMANDAQRMPSRESNYRNLILNQRVEASNPFITKTVWMECGGPVAEDWGKKPVYAGLDLSAVTDLTAFEAICQIDGIWHVRSTFWLPQDNLLERAKQDKVPYDLWHEDGYLDTTPGKSVEYEYVAIRLREMFSEMNIRKVAFDRWGFRHLKPWLLKAGFTEKDLTERFEEFGQGYQSMTPALRSLEGMIINKKMAHGNHPVLSMCAANAVVHQDPAGNRKLDKAKSRGRIDGLVALAMASSVAVANAEAPKQFQVMFV